MYHVHIRIALPEGLSPALRIDPYRYTLCNQVQRLQGLRRLVQGVLEEDRDDNRNRATIGDHKGRVVQ